MAKQSDLIVDTTVIRRAYQHFLNAEADRILLTGHSHQAWPDVVRDALVQFFDDSARLVDRKWEQAIFPKAELVGRSILSRMGFAETDAIAFGKSTHELVSRLFSCLRPHTHPRIVTTLGEFHSLDRQLRRLAEEGTFVEWIEAKDRERLADRLLAALTDGTTMLALSAVLFEDAYVVPRLPEILARAAEVGAIPLVDAYHAFNVVPIAWGPARDSLFVTAGSYKYAGFGEGLCWLRIPPNCTLRPVDTGWFADFASLAGPRKPPGNELVSYGAGGARFTGASFDGSAFYRAEAGFAHWDRLGLSVDHLRAISTKQTRRIISVFEASGEVHRIASSTDDARRGGFVAVRARHPSEVVQRLSKRGVWVDARGDVVRLGPAPYLTDDEIDRGSQLVVDVIRETELR